MGADPELGKTSPLRPGSGGQASSRGDWLISCSRFLNGLTAVCALLCIAAHLMAISVAAHYPKVFTMCSLETCFSNVLSSSSVFLPFMCACCGTSLCSARAVGAA